MNGNVLLDTNIVIALFADDANVRQHIAHVTEAFVPSIVIGELYYGARKSVRVETNLARIDEFAARSAVLPCDVLTAQSYGRIKNTLHAKGRPIPENDLWIAAVAEQHQLMLATRDAHFDEIEGLRVVRW